MNIDQIIASKIKLKPIAEVAKQLNLQSDQLMAFGDNIAKIKTNSVKTQPNGKLILVTAINPTPAGEGKTTVNIGLAMALQRIGKRAVSVLREPSLGPVFGIKGGATGGGHSQVLPMEEINLHFTGDFHAITTANNLLASAIDNHIYFGNQLGFERVTFQRCLDLNDRVLRRVEVGDSKHRRSDNFNITAASELMAIFCLAKNINDLQHKIEQIIIGYDKQNQVILAKELGVAGAMVAVLQKAIEPNLVQTTEHTPAIIHGGPFANIAHGCNSIVATDLGLKLADYVVAEAGFGADLGAEKFFDIKCQVNNLKPSVVVLVATIRSLKYQGGADLNELIKPNLTALQIGLAHLERHLQNLAKFGVEIVVAINKFVTDDESEIALLSDYLKTHNIDFALTEIWEHGSKGGVDLARKVVNKCQLDNNFKPIYDLKDDLKTKINKVAIQIYRADKVVYSESAQADLKNITANFNHLPICIAKTQTSFSDNPELLNAPQNFDLHVREVAVDAGAGFVVVKTGDIMTMPGLSKRPSYLDIDVVDDKIQGLH